MNSTESQPKINQKDPTPEGFLQYRLPLYLAYALFLYLIYAVGWGFHEKTVSIQKVAGFGSYVNWASGVNEDGYHAEDAHLNFPMGIAVDPAGNLYIADTYNHMIRKVTPDGIIHTIAGTGDKGFSGDGKLAIFAHLNRPFDIALDESGNLYFADSDNNRIRKIDSEGIITTVAGTDGWGYFGSGLPARRSPLYWPVDIAIDDRHNLFIADAANFCVRKVTPDGKMVTVAGTHQPGFSGDDGPATKAQFNTIESVALDPQGNLYIADTGNNRVREVTRDGLVHTIAGRAPLGKWAGFIKSFTWGDGGPATYAVLDHPHDLALDVKGNLYIADNYHSRVRRVTPDGKISTVVGRVRWPRFDFWADNDHANSNWLNDPRGLTVDAQGNLYIADGGNYCVRKALLKAAPGLLAGRPMLPP